VRKDGVVRLIPLGDQARAIGAILVAALFTFQESIAFAQPPMPAPSNSGQAQAQTLPPDQLDSLVAPIALYPDPLLSQVLVASTYPLEIVQAGRWLKQNSGLKGKSLTDAAAKQPWDPSIQALVLFPEVLSQMDQNIGWTTDLGNAFLAQESAVLDAVQRMRQEAEQRGNLNSTPQQTVTASNGGYIEIQPTNPQVIYVPQYVPDAVWGPPAYYPYPAIVYPSTGALVATGIISFGAGVAVGALVSGGGGWGWGFGWGNRAVIVNNNFIRTNHFNRVNVANGNQWRHNPEHRRAVPYNNAAVGGRFKPGTANNLPNRPNPAQTQQRLGQAERRAGQGHWTGRVPGQAGQGNIGQRLPGQTQGGRGNLGQRPAQNPAVRPPANIGSANRAIPNNMGNRIGGRQIAPNAGRGMFGGMNAGGGRARMNSNRGFSSAGGFRRGGGGRGGGRRR
jgi:Protein of unknown function (DUF3300)